MKNKSTANITAFTDETLTLLGKKIREALTAIGETYGVKFDLGRITYYADNTASAKLKFETIQTADGQTVDRARETWTKYNCSSFGLKFEWLDKTFTVRGQEHKIVGLNPSRKYCVNTTCISNGKSYSF